ncbi:MAG TPA: YihY/virulence factor BrkB family protein [Candidatus Polarisedimenticolaceae bacterium]|nr:YihY/virulence factor BrkB family protein [Candidatus Polarisedimenticolaceae bacterium]
MGRFRPGGWPGLGWRALRNFWNDGCPNLAAMVAFWAILGLGPSVYLVGFFLGGLLPADRTALQQLAAYLPREAEPFVDDLAKSLLQGRGLLVLALPGLIWIASGAFLALEYAINVAFATVRRRRFWLSRLKAFVAAAAVASVLAGSLVADHVAALVDAYRHTLGLSPWLGPLGRAVSYAVHLLLNFGAFAALYKVLPRGRVRWSAVAWSALTAVVLWEAARRVFGRMLANSTAYGEVTGTLAGIVAVLLWIYTSVAVTLLAAELAAVLNGNREDMVPAALS